MRKIKFVLATFTLVLLSAMASGCHYDHHYGGGHGHGYIYGGYSGGHGGGHCH